MTASLRARAEAIVQKWASRLDRGAFGHSDGVRLRDAIYAALTEVAQTPAWQPIETAPKDGTPVLVALIRDARVWRVSDARFAKIGWYTDSGGQGCHWTTHWMPLPAAPVDGGRRASAEAAVPGKPASTMLTACSHGRIDKCEWCESIAARLWASPAPEETGD